MSSHGHVVPEELGSPASTGSSPDRTLIRPKNMGKRRRLSRNFGGSAERLQETFMENLKRGSPSPPLTNGPDYSPDGKDLLSRRLTLQHQDLDPDMIDRRGAPAVPETCPNSREGWSKVSKVLHDYDDNKIKVVKEDIDTLLVFAGLFSAVLTAFVIESYQKLQEDSSDVSARLLLQISQQLASFAVTSSFINSTTVVYPQPMFQASASMVRINAFWFSSLTCSLVTASLGILVKQWLHEYMSDDSLSPRAHIRIRQFRYEGLVRWRVFELAAMLPLLVQLALVLFFVGLSEFLRILNPVIGWTVTALILFWAAIFVTTAFASVFSSQCPYKSRILKGMLQRIRPTLFVALNCILYGPIRIFQPLRFVLRTLHLPRNSLGKNISSSGRCVRLTLATFATCISKWYGASVVYHVDVSPPPEEKEVRGDTAFDMPCLASADALFLDDGFLEPVRECLMSVELTDALPCIRQIVSYRCDLSLETLEDLPLHWSTMGQMTRAGTLCLQRTVVDLINKEVDRILSFHGEFKASEWSAEIAEAVFFVVAADFLFMEQENVREVFGRLLGLDVITARGVIDALCKHPSYNPSPQVPCTDFLPNILAVTHYLLDRNLVEESPDSDAEADGESVFSAHPLPPDESLDPVKLCMIIFSFIDQVPVSDILSNAESFMSLQSKFAAVIHNYLQAGRAVIWAPRTPTWSMNILRYLQHHIPEYIVEDLLDALDAAAACQLSKQDHLRDSDGHFCQW
ncbi:unnamed protein product [Somion occarium]|uniref:DUF6535 domain-containing protein n=1 Tax=Somion occarium TaxID=3059160 RepID=A0ABP1CIJ8_9APHY